MSSIPRSGRSPGKGNGYPLQYSCLENPMDRGAWWVIAHGVAKSQTRLSGWAQSSIIFTNPQLPYNYPPDRGGHFRGRQCLWAASPPALREACRDPLQEETSCPGSGLTLWSHGSGVVATWRISTVGMSPPSASLLPGLALLPQFLPLPHQGQSCHDLLFSGSQGFYTERMGMGDRAGEEGRKRKENTAFKKEQNFF